MSDYTQRFPQGDKNLGERPMTDAELKDLKHNALLQYFARLERQTYYHAQLFKENPLPF